MKLFLLVAPFVTLLEAQAVDTDWFVLSSRGKSVACGQNKVKVGNRFPTGCLAVTGKESFLKIVSRSGVLLVIGPNSKVQLGPTSMPAATAIDSALVEQGITRWVFKKGNKGAAAFRVMTPNAVMGVRGTDVLLTYNALLDESEVVSFEGDIEFGGKIEKFAPIQVATGQWGGVGGRFGEAPAKPLALPEELVKQLRASIHVKTQAKKVTASDAYYGEAVPKDF